jgi:MYXO-CTERM domain-containing protein
MRRLHAWVVLACVSFPTVVLAHTSVGGGSSGGGRDPNADCLRWEEVPVTAADAGAVDAGDGSAPDGGAPTKTVLTCVEHATMFGCACAVGREARGAPAGALGAAAAAALGLGLRRRRRGR